MSAHSLKSAMHRGIDRSLRRVGGMVLLPVALLLLLPSVAFAFTPSVFAASDPTQNVAQAGVSVVRLVVSYTVSSTPATTLPVQCTGLGVLVNSWTAGSTTEKSTWVLTDGSLVNPSKMTCGTLPIASPGGTASGTARLTQIQVFASMGPGGYRTTSTSPLLLATIKDRTAVTCEETDCTQGLALIGFPTTQPQPFIDTSTASSGTGQNGIELVKGGSISGINPTQASQYLTPLAVPESTTAEPGMPVVDTMGNLLGIHLHNGASLPLATITEFIDSTVPQQHPTNALHDNWDKGIQAYYKHDYPTAKNDFKLAAAANPQFEAATFFMNRAATQVSSGNGGGVRTGGQGQTGKTEATGGSNGLLGFSFWQVSVGSLILLLLVVIVVSLLVARARTRRQDMEQYTAEEKAAAEQAARDAARIAETEARQGQGQPQGARNGRPLSPAPGEPSSFPPAPMVNVNNMQAQPYAAQVPPQASPVLDMRCPQCGNPVSSSARTCPYCNALLTPPDVAMPQQAPQYQPPPVSPPPQAVPAPSYAQAAPQFARADQPTMVFGKNGPVEGEQTLLLQPDIRRGGGSDVGLVVGTRTDPGIKRKHKPNEDSLFAAQGAGMFNATPRQFGLFVVADGMGGHANGQDASRLAIQTIIDYVLPRLSGGDGLDRNTLVQLLTDGVQRANQAVFQSNMQHHADMGTTMTTALVVGPTAYVANVGDSRTYLYRDQKLTKITNDHSVVASLVEAGIIKPDDIYTHPKRNQIYRSLGEKPSVEVDSFTVDLRPGDKLLLCTDGLWDMVRDPAIQQVLANPTASPEQTGDALIQAALDGGGEDNVSLIVVYVTGSPDQPVKTGVRLLYKPETVQMPPM
jgi:serine/threonine protein phosphatase PrpC